MPQYKLMVARFPGNYSEHPASSQWVMEVVPKMQRDSRVSDVFSWWKSSTPITVVRNLAAKVALEAKVDYLVMIDSDMQPDGCRSEGSRPFWESSWEFMMKHTSMPCAVASPYCGPPPDENVYVSEFDRPESGTANLNYKLRNIDRADAIRRSGIGKVAGLPTGLIILDTRLFKHVPIPWFAYEYNADHTAIDSTEDYFFTRNASLLGFPMYCNWDAWSGHYKMKMVGKPDPICAHHIGLEMRGALLRDHASDILEYKLEDLENAPTGNPSG